MSSEPTPAQWATDEEINAAHNEPRLLQTWFADAQIPRLWATDDGEDAIPIVEAATISGAQKIAILHNALLRNLHTNIAARREAEEDAAILASIIIDLDNEEEPTDERKREAGGIAKRRYEWFELLAERDDPRAAVEGLRAMIRDIDGVHQSNWERKHMATLHTIADLIAAQQEQIHGQENRTVRMNNRACDAIAQLNADLRLVKVETPAGADGK